MFRGTGAHVIDTFVTFTTIIKFWTMECVKQIWFISCNKTQSSNEERHTNKQFHVGRYIEKQTRLQLYWLSGNYLFWPAAAINYVKKAFTETTLCIQWIQSLCTATTPWYDEMSKIHVSWNKQVTFYITETRAVRNRCLLEPTVIITDRNAV